MWHLSVQAQLCLAEIVPEAAFDPLSHQRGSTLSLLVLRFNQGFCTTVGHPSLLGSAPQLAQNRRLQPHTQNIPKLYTAALLEDPIQANQTTHRTPETTGCGKQLLDPVAAEEGCFDGSKSGPLWSCWPTRTSRDQGPRRPRTCDAIERL